MSRPDQWVSRNHDITLSIRNWEPPPSSSRPLEQRPASGDRAARSAHAEHAGADAVGATTSAADLSRAGVTLVEPKDVAASYDRIAHVWDGDDFPRSNGIAQHERAIAFTALRGAALDVGCGCSGRLIDLLIENGFEPQGLDLSPVMLERARRRHPEVRFHAGDIRHWPLPQPFAFITAWDSIWHVPLPDQADVLRKLLRGLAPGGIAVFSIGGTDEPSETVDAHMGPPMYHATLGIPDTLEIVRECGVVCRHLEYDQYPELHVALICQRPG